MVLNNLHIPTALRSLLIDHPNLPVQKVEDIGKRWSFGKAKVSKEHFTSACIGSQAHFMYIGEANPINVGEAPRMGPSVEARSYRTDEGYHRHWSSFWSDKECVDH